MKCHPILRFIRDCLVAFLIVYGVLAVMGALDARARRIHADELKSLFAVARAECAQKDRDDAWRDLEQRAAVLTAPIGAGLSASGSQQ